MRTVGRSAWERAAVHEAELYSIVSWKTLPSSPRWISWVWLTAPTLKLTPVVYPGSGKKAFRILRRGAGRVQGGGYSQFTILHPTKCLNWGQNKDIHRYSQYRNCSPSTVSHLTTMYLFSGTFWKICPPNWEKSGFWGFQLKKVEDASVPALPDPRSAAEGEPGKTAAQKIQWLISPGWRWSEALGGTSSIRKAF